MYRREKTRFKPQRSLSTESTERRSFLTCHAERRVSSAIEYKTSNKTEATYEKLTTTPTSVSDKTSVHRNTTKNNRRKSIKKRKLKRGVSIKPPYDKDEEPVISDENYQNDLETNSYLYLPMQHNMAHQKAFVDEAYRQSRTKNVDNEVLPESGTYRTYAPCITVEDVNIETRDDFKNALAKSFMQEEPVTKVTKKIKIVIGKKAKKKLKKKARSINLQLT